MKITIFTPTYNRAYIIENLYRSLQRQTCMDFEWLVVDDGSLDNTAELFAQWQQEANPFPIRYVWQENGGKHRATNHGVLHAGGKYFFIVDSDDWLMPNAVEIICGQMDSLPETGTVKYAGVCNCKGYTPTQTVGTTFEGEFIDCTALQRMEYGITGDKAEVFFTEVMRQYPFPEFPGEKFITECSVWDKMAADGYLLRFYNVITYLCEYRDDGLTKQGLDLYYHNPLGYGYVLRLARENNKYSKGLSDFYDAECFWHWRNKMSLFEIAALIGTNPGRLLYISLLHRARETASKIKRMIIIVLGM